MIFKGLHNIFKSHAMTVLQLKDCRFQKHILSVYDKLQLQNMYVLIYNKGEMHFHYYHYK